MLLKLIKSRFDTHNERSGKALKNIVLSFIYKGGNMAINIILVPLTISFVNPKEYGIWLTLSSIIAWFAISDIGFGNGLRNKFAEAVAKGDKDLAKSYVSTTYITVAIMMSMIWVIFFVCNYFINWTIILNTDKSLASEIQITVLIIVSFFVTQFILKLVGTVLIANQDPGKSASFDFYSNLLILAGIYYLIKTDVKGNLVMLSLITGSFQLLTFIAASIWFYSKSLKEYRPSYKFFDKIHIKSLIGIGLKFFIIQIASIFVFQSTNIIITQISDPENVTVYNICYRYFTIPYTISLIVVSPLWAAFTDAYTKDDYVWMKNILIKLKYFALTITIILILFYVFSDFLYKHWVGDKVKIPKAVSLAMMLNILASTIFNIYIFVINGVGKLYLQLITTIVLSFIFVPLAILFGNYFGLVGIILANFLINVVYALLIPIQAYKIVYRKAQGIWNK